LIKELAIEKEIIVFTSAGGFDGQAPMVNRVSSSKVGRRVQYVTAWQGSKKDSWTVGAAGIGYLHRGRGC
jgi:hypothetical protein